MSLANGARLGAYGIIAPLGAGGMGEVYRGRDTKLDREVAIKILPDALAHDPERLARFEREAKVLASLNHPNIAQIYGIEESSGVRALVMELVPGQTLAEAEKAPLGLETALNYARQIAEALETAHEKGIVHRDLKPANVMITPDGVVKVLDFGLAAVPSRDAASGSDPHNSPTFTMAATQAGFIMGTAGYMAPEQAAGKVVDKRADIWAFGVVLYEMLTCERLFDGETVSHTLADVLRAPIDFGKLPRDTPPSIRNLVERCLERNVKNRLRDIGEARVIIERVGKEPAVQQTASSVSAPPAAGGTAAWAIAGLFLLSTAGLAFVHFRESPAPQRVMRFQIAMPEKVTESIFELSPDGRTLAFTASEGGHQRMWIRPIDSVAAQPVPGTDDARYVFWSPDGGYIGFFAPGKLKKIALAGGPAQTLCDAASGRGGTWNKDGVIVFAPGLALPLMRVSAAGGVPTPATTLGSADELQRYPVFLPDGKHFLFEVFNGKAGTNGVYAGALDGSPRVRVLADESSVAYVASSASGKSGLLLFRREGTLLAQPFDPGAVRTTGDAFPVAEQISISGNTDHAAFSVSGNGLLAYGSGGLGLGLTNGSLAWMDRNGARTTIGQPAEIITQALSPDGKQVSLSTRTQGEDGSDLWMLDIARGVPSRFTFRAGRSSEPVWSPDGSHIIFAVDNNFIYEKPANGAGTEELLLSGGLNIRPQDWSRDGKWLVYMLAGSKTGTDLWLLPLEGERKPVPYLQTPFNESDAQFSPDGRWMAYASNESGQPQVYVQSIPAGGSKFQISNVGGGQPRWRRDGKELFFISTDNKLMAVPLKIGNTVEAGPPKPVFDFQPIFPSLFGRWAYEPTADGQRFLVLTETGAANPPLTVVLNWQAGIRR
jgi:Tol biopolymer transport system component/tRNA A-37 threonylcarbamoyl transferase component Bud32